VHTVEAGDSLYWIALTYGLSIAELKELNNLKSDVLRVGQRLLVPVDQVKHYPVGVALDQPGSGMAGADDLRRSPG